MVLILNRESVMAVLQMKDCISALDSAFTELSNGSAVLPLRIGINAPDGVSLYMPAYLKQMNALACKVVSVYKNNPQKHQLPTTIGKVLVQNPETGEVICIMDGGYLTAVRTGAVSGLATQYLARSGSDMVAAIFGAGVQAQMQLWGVCEVRKLKYALVYDSVPGAAQKFVEVMQPKLGIEIKIAQTIEEMYAADIICTATSSPTPIFDGSAVKAGTHINGIGSHSPGARELDSAIIKRSLLIADARDACLNEAGDVMIPIKEGVITPEHIYADLGEIVTGKKISRTSDEQITLFKSNGLAIQDVAASRLVYERAREAGLGVEVDL